VARLTLALKHEYDENAITIFLVEEGMNEALHQYLINID